MTLALALLVGSVVGGAVMHIHHARQAEEERRRAELQRWQRQQRLSRRNHSEADL